MNRKGQRLVKSLFSLGLLLVCLFISPIITQGKTILTKKQTAEYLDKISAYEMKKVTNPAYGSVGGEWLVLGLARYGTLTEDYRNIYLENVREEVEKCNGVLSEKKYTEYARLVLALTAVGSNPENFAGYNLIEPLAELDNILKTGISGVTFSLLALDSADYNIPDTKKEYTGRKTTRENLITILLNAQLEDGGWAYAGSKSDVDVTAMALQALAKYSEQDKVKKAVNKGINWLSDNQKESGGFATGEIENCESTAQALLAMMTLNIKVSDNRFVKNGNTVLDGLLQYYKDGGFKHTENSFVNQMATEQAMYSLTSYYLSLDEDKDLYDMKDNITHNKTAKSSSNKNIAKKAKNKKKKENNNTNKSIKNETSKNKNESSKNIKNPTKGKEQQKETTGKNENKNKNKISENNLENSNQNATDSVEETKISDKKTNKNADNKWIGIVFGVLALIGVGILLCKKNRLFTMLLVVCLVFSGCGKKSEGKDAGTCTILVECSTIFDNLEDLDKGLEEHIPKNGVILKEQTVTFKENDTVYDILSRELKKNNILMEVSFTGKSAYIEGIDNLYEFSCGPLSGWTYAVNGQVPQVSCSDYKIKDGDRIQWRYTCDLGEDVKNKN